MTGLILWLAAGTVAGVAGRLLLPGPTASWLAMIACGGVGGFVGGLAATLMDMGGIAELDPRAGVLALLVAVLFVVLYQLIRTRRA